MFLMTHSAPFVKPSVTSTFVVKSYFALVAIEVSEYKPIVFVGSFGILSFICFLRSSEISPTTMSIAFIWHLSLSHLAYMLLLCAFTDAFVVNKWVVSMG